ncbi:MAG TPA: hypothetical protein VJ521_09725, partial [Acidobacteriota bacterium]|nr:hypothetical protein [Acidobacteriota bacterium]
MRLRQIRTIFAKEILDTLRDRRTILIMIVIPVLLYPGLMIFMNELATAQQAKMERKTLKVAVVNIAEDSELMKRLRSTKGIELVNVEDPVAAVKEGNLHYVLSASSDLEEMLSETKTATIELSYDRANDDAGANLDRIRRIVDMYEQDLVMQRLKQRGIPEEY